VEGATVKFKFKGKSGKQHEIGLSDRRLARIVKRCLDLPGYELFQYIDNDGSLHTVDSSDVNEYLRTITEQPFTAKDFRTWAGTVLACLALRECEACETQTQAKKNVVEAIKRVATRLGNTPSVCKKCYVHPAVLDAYMGGQMGLKQATGVVEQAGKELEHALEEEIAKDPNALREEEHALLKLLQGKVAKAA
jgi:DNA topoisomerase I